MHACSCDYMSILSVFQPALLYLVPFGLIVPILTAVATGNFSALWKFDAP